MNECQNCLFYLEINNTLLITGQKSHICRRYPPQGFTIPAQGMNGRQSVQIMYRNPEVQPDGWCGEFENKVEQKEPEFGIYVTQDD